MKLVHNTTATQQRNSEGPQRVTNEYRGGLRAVSCMEAKPQQGRRRATTSSAMDTSVCRASSCTARGACCAKRRSSAAATVGTGAGEDRANGEGPRGGGSCRGQAVARTCVFAPRASRAVASDAAKTAAFVALGVLCLVYSLVCWAVIAPVSGTQRRRQVEIGVAVWLGTLVLLSDGFHNLSDVVALGALQRAFHTGPAASTCNQVWACGPARPRAGLRRSNLRMAGSAWS